MKIEYKKASLAVQKKNYAVKMYKSVGFEIVDETYYLIKSYMGKIRIGNGR